MQVYKMDSELSSLTYEDLLAEFQIAHLHSCGTKEDQAYYKQVGQKILALTGR
jgi:hypothetical protein